MADSYRRHDSPHLQSRQTSRNPILTKDDVGRAKPSVHDLPADGYTYGRPEPMTPEGVRELMTWVPHTPSRPPRPQDPDFERLNKAAGRHRATSPQAVAKLRTSCDFSMKPPPSPPPKLIPSDVFPTWTYGREERPSTPISTVLSHDYGRAAEACREDRYRKYDEERARQQQPLKVQLRKTDQWRINQGRRRRAEAEMDREPPKGWKMSKFSNVESHFRQEGQLYALADGGKSKSLPDLHQTSTGRSTTPMALPRPCSRAGEASERGVSPQQPAVLRWPTGSIHSSASPTTPVSRGPTPRAASRGNSKEVLLSPEHHGRGQGQRSCRSPMAAPPQRSPSLPALAIGSTARFGAGKLLEDTPREDTARDAESDTESACSFASGLSNIKAEDCEAHTPTPRRKQVQISDVTEADIVEGSPMAANVEEDVKVFMSVCVESQDDLQDAAGVMERQVRSTFNDYVVKVKDFAMPSPKQSQRTQRTRYMAWGQEGLSCVDRSQAKPATVATPLVMNLLVRHASVEELADLIERLVACIESAFTEGAVKVRKVNPPLWSPPAKASPPKPRPRDGLGRLLLAP
eukprot:TRINITY_DN24666_c0_g1_i1.p1 TRINITY_DN24666_c0_g1~~TRINITY_DN24666_c0_g1_i1.p1  ORF type:complete len:575 (+),score=71.15 TRINITY_DN24666_c0_g1_i1:145-1869(+)